jgi:glucose-6-phosphate isomerase
MNFRAQLPPDLQSAVTAATNDWQQNNKLDKLWSRDASLWTDTDESKWLAWLDVADRQQKDLAAFRALASDIVSAGFEYALLLGMGGSSLCPEVLALTFGQQKGFPALHIVDSTAPEQIAAAEKAVNLKKTVCIVSSKSGSTLEPNILKQYFFARMQEAVGADQAGQHFIAVTDPGSKMEQVAKADKFRHIFYGDPGIGGRYSALSNFGIIPATIMGLDIERMLGRAAEAEKACRNKDLIANPGVHLGLIMGECAKAGRDKITFFTSEEIYDLGAWIEQLIAESTGKDGRGITPVDREEIASPEHYGSDRLFAYMRLEGTRSTDLDAKVEALAAAGHPVVHFSLTDTYDIAGQFFTWEIATATAGSVININAFNQPDVEASKIETKKLTTEYEETGKLEEKEPIFVGDRLNLYAGPRYAAVLHGALDRGATDAEAYLIAHLSQIKAGDYFAVLAYVQMNENHEEILQGFRHKVRDAKKVATCLGFGPRFLHSTGQDYKGGPNTGVFLQITADHEKDLAIPGQKYTFGVVIAAQAAGDFSVLEQRGRRALRVHIGPDIEGGLKHLAKLVEKSLG